MSKIAVVRVRGVTGIRKEIKDTLTMLNLHKKNFCVILDGSPEKMGMLMKVKDYVTWGEIDEDALKQLESKRGSGKKFYRLNSPLKGYGRKGVKVPFSKGGALGNRKEKINDLIKRMI
jgi:large subunit ribosomal protein L30